MDKAKETRIDGMKGMARVATWRCFGLTLADKVAKPWPSPSRPHVLTVRHPAHAKICTAARPIRPSPIRAAKSSALGKAVGAAWKF